MSFKIGDLVSLIGGGPVLTVTMDAETSPTGRVYCDWFTADDVLHRDSFVPDALALFGPEDL